MSGWYDGWREAKKRLETKPDDEFLQNLVNNLRGLALQEYVERAFRHMDIDGMFEPGDISADDVQKFLVGLDELREPPKTAVDEARSEAFAEAVEVLGKMKNLNWTGDHLYGDALDDAQVILSYVRAGRKWPVLERFRCPSLFQVGDRKLNGPYHCEQQLPHNGPHTATGLRGKAVTWTDEQSLNPPVPYGDTPSTQNVCGDRWAPTGETCALPKGHDSRHSTDGDGPLSWPNVTQSRCPEWHNAVGMQGRCVKKASHEGPHVAEPYDGSQELLVWNNEGSCHEQHVLTDNDGGAETVHCSMYKGHAGPSHFDVRSGSSWPVA